MVEKRYRVERVASFVRIIAVDTWSNTWEIGSIVAEFRFSYRRANNRDDSVNHHGTRVCIRIHGPGMICGLDAGFGLRARKPLTSANRCGL